MHVGGEGTVWLWVESELNQSVPSLTVHRCIPSCPSKENWYLQRKLASVAYRAKRRVNGVALLDPLDSASGMPQLSKLSILCAFCQLSSKVLAQLASAGPSIAIHRSACCLSFGQEQTGRPERWWPLRAGAMRMPTLDVYEEKDDLVVKADLPSLTKAEPVGYLTQRR